jgi:hypothetical protein
MNLAVEVALDAVEASVHRRLGIALGGHHAAILGGDHDAAAHAAEAAHALVPLPVLFARLDGGFGLFGQGHAHRGRRAGGDAGFQEIHVE